MCAIKVFSKREQRYVQPGLGDTSLWTFRYPSKTSLLIDGNLLLCLKICKFHFILRVLYHWMIIVFSTYDRWYLECCKDNHIVTRAKPN